MKKCVMLMLCLGAFAINSYSQIQTPEFGKGIQILGKDSSYYSKIGYRFQNLYVGSWTINDGLTDYKASFLVRRMRLKFDGWAVNPKIKYKLELALSNRDNSGGSGPEFRKAANIVLDASVSYNFYKNFTIQFGQRKLPGNVERVI
ncbi:MAG: porin, partial [Saprospiraceae bacterium]|nr:porin [Saprospiraceae bacterium]